MDFMASRMDTVCFTGHRPEKLEQSEEQVRAALRIGIDRALKWKYSTFITGMAQGVDLWAAGDEERTPESQAGLCDPVGYAEKWDNEWKAKYEAVKTSADEVYTICPRNTRSAPVIQDKWMVDHSSLVIAVHSGEKGGTKTTVEYAEKQKIQEIGKAEKFIIFLCNVTASAL